MSLMFRGTLVISSIITDAGNVVESADVSLPLSCETADTHWQATRESADGAADSLLIAALPIVVFEEAGSVAMSRIDLVYLRNRSGDSIKVTLPSLAFSVSEVTIPGGGVMLLSSSEGYDVDAGDSLVVESAENIPVGFSYDILLVGTKEQA